MLANSGSTFVSTAPGRVVRGYGICIHNILFIVQRAFCPTLQILRGAYREYLLLTTDPFLIALPVKLSYTFITWIRLSTFG